MNQTKSLAITISRQLGCGGAYIGQQLAKELNIYYADREIIRKAAEQLSVSEEDLGLQDEKPQSFWDPFMQYSVYAPDIYVPPPMKIMPTSYSLFNAETEIIQHIVEEHSAVIIGRCGFYVLRDYPNHVSIFLHGDTSFRSKRIQETYNVSEKVAGEMIVQSDKDREHYVHAFTGKKWIDTRLYDLTIDTSKTGVDKSVEVIISYLKVNEFIEECQGKLQEAK